jgi:hypothetical protein
MQTRQAANFHQLAGHIPHYAAGKDRTVLVSSNPCDGAPWHRPLVADVDIVVPEQRHTLFEQPGWMRYIAGFAGDKPVCVSTNPYDGVLPGLLPRRVLLPIPGHVLLGRRARRHYVRGVRRVDGQRQRGRRMGAARGTVEIQDFSATLVRPMSLTTAP